MAVAGADAVAEAPLADSELAGMDAYWRAANYLAAGQIHLVDNPLLREPLAPEHIKRQVLGHWGVTPALNFVYVHLNRVIKAHDLDVVYVTGPGHGGPALVANTYLEGTYTEAYPAVTQDADGMRRLFERFSFASGASSHAATGVPGSIQEGAERGYTLSHAFGAAFDNPDLIVACVVGDGEAETGPLAVSWHSTRFLDPIHDGAVLPILHLNGPSVSNPTVLGRMAPEELESLLIGYGWKPHIVQGSDPQLMHQRMAAALDVTLREIADAQREARTARTTRRPRWPVIVLRTPRGWTRPEDLAGRRTDDELEHLERWLRSYRPQELFDEDGRLVAEAGAFAPQDDRRMGANPHANGGKLVRELRLPDLRDFAVQVPKPGGTTAEATCPVGGFLREIVWLNRDQPNFRVIGEAPPAYDRDEPVSQPRSEHTCQGWLEGYLLTGRHGLLCCDESAIRVVDDMFNRHARWLKAARELAWRRPIPSLNYLLTSDVWRPDHDGSRYPDPGFVDHLVNSHTGVAEVWLPPDANTLLATLDQCLRSRDLVNVIVAGAHPAPQLLDIEAATNHCAKGIGIWDWASNDHDSEPDVVMACAGDVPTLETVAAVDLLRRRFKHLRVRVVNVVDLMTLQPQAEHPRGLSDRDFDAIFTADKPILFAYRGQPWLIHRLTHRRTNHANLHVRGLEAASTNATTPFDVCVRSAVDRYSLVCDVIDLLVHPAHGSAYVRQAMRDKLIEHERYVSAHGVDLPEVIGWLWPH